MRTAAIRPTAIPLPLTRRDHGGAARLQAAGARLRLAEQPGGARGGGRPAAGDGGPRALRCTAPDGQPLPPLPCARHLRRRGGQAARGGGAPHDAHGPAHRLAARERHGGRRLRVRPLLLDHAPRPDRRWAVQGPRPGLLPRPLPQGVAHTRRQEARSGVQGWEPAVGAQQLEPQCSVRGDGAGGRQPPTLFARLFANASPTSFFANALRQRPQRRPQRRRRRRRRRRDRGPH
eukprot:scaffold40399_cov67-Phaeocystis_antarctica.AAC.4